MDKVLVIGLDGVPFQLIREWVEEGLMPNLAALVRRGCFGGLQSTIPPTSAPSWSSFLTGMNPGKTGIYDFLYRRPGTYQFPPIDSRLRRGRPLWSLVNDAGGRVGVVNIPMSYPVDKVDGFMVSGWMTPHSAEDYTHPPDLAAELKEAIGYYQIYPMETFSERNRQTFLDASYRLLKMRTEANLHLMKKDWDLFLTVFFDTDRILHQLWHYLDPEHPWRAGDGRGDLSGDVREYFRELDRCIGLLLGEVDDGTTVMVMSDHGMGPAHRFVVLNNWLLSSGYMTMRRGAVTGFKKWLFNRGFTLRNIHILLDRLGLARHAEYKANYFIDHILKRVFLSFNDVDWSRTRAYSYGRMLGAIYLNVRGREPEGIIEPGEEYRRLREELVDSLEGFRDPSSGEKMIGRVSMKEDVYQGPALEEAPDLILWPAEPTDIFFGLSDFGAARMVDQVYRYSGMHRDQGVLIAAGPGIRKDSLISQAGIADMAPTILYAMGLPVPGDMDGRVLDSLFEESHLREKSPVVAGETMVGEMVGDSAYSADEEEEIMKRLGDLGYLG
jgi:predicted AlkP superfamily phosphohydrolase/phosphomutase